MPLGQVVKAVVEQPLLAIYDAVFTEIRSHVMSVGASLILFGLALNVALLPIYRRMEDARRKAAGSREAMDAEIERIKRHYRGRERFYYIRTIHRQCGYRPTSAILISGNLYLEILVFVTVYRYLSSIWALHGTSFLAIGDLSRPDGLLFGVNVLPIVMTALNIASAVYYSPSRSARYLAFVVASAFLVILYASPSGVALYWSVNNAFSLVRNVCDRKLARLLPDGLKRQLSSVTCQE